MTKQTRYLRESGGGIVLNSTRHPCAKGLMMLGMKRIYRRLVGVCKPHIEKKRLAALPRAVCDTSALGVFTASWLTETFADGRINADWDEDGRQIAGLDLPEMTGGANPGDCRALYHLVRRLKPQRILEIGTHLGCSTVTQAMAVARNRADGIAATLDTVDIRDVNDPQTRPWLKFKSPHSPRENIATLGCEEFVRFEVGRSLEVLADSHRRYGMIFLDGDHSAKVVYQEIPLALQRLEPPGLIMLHDYFPDQRPLWPGQKPIIGPNLGVGRIVSEGASLHAVPLGDLPWPTKLGTQTTSLAVLTRA